MKTLTTPVANEAAASQAAWVQVFDFYLPSTITTPAGSSNRIRITDCPGGLNFFTPTELPEPVATQGDTQAYAFWPVKRELIKASAKFSNDTMTIAVSNVTTEYASMIEAIDWEGVPVVIRKVPNSGTSTLTADDCAIIFSGLIDSMTITNEIVQFTLSNDLGQFQTTLPRENMHPNCRFQWGDDQCTAIRYHANNYKAKTAGSSGTTTRVISSDFTEDTVLAPYVDQSVTADSTTDKITFTSHQLGDGSLVKFGGTAVPGGLTAGLWYYVVNAWQDEFQVALTEGGAAIDLTSNGTSVTVTSSELYPDTGYFYGSSVTVDSTTDVITRVAHGLQTGRAIRFRATSMPGGLTSGTTYYPVNITVDTFKVALTSEGTAIDITSNGTTVVMDGKAYDLVGVLNNSAITASSEAAAYVGENVSFFAATAGYQIKFQFSKPLVDGQRVKFTGSVISPVVAGTYYYAFADTVSGYLVLRTSPNGDNIIASATGYYLNSTTLDTEGGGDAYRVRLNMAGGWIFNTSADWGTVTQGYWQIPDAQAGLKNPGLKPYIQFDFGSAKQPFTWRIKGASGADRASLPRLVQFFSSTDNASWKFETYFELPPRGDFFDVLIPGAQSARYWRICIRSKWSDVLNKSCFESVRAYEYSRHWWRSGRITFASNTTTTALRGITRAVLESYAGEVRVAALPTAPVNGDTFTIERGCSNTFNDCAARGNTENFGGFDSIPVQTVVR